MKSPHLSAAACLLLSTATAPRPVAAENPAATAAPAAATPATTATPATITITDDFEQGFTRWQPTAPENWKLSEDHGGRVLDLFDKTARTSPPHRSPFNFVLLQNQSFGDVSITASVQTTTQAYGHRDTVVIFGYQDPAHFYYVHFGEKADNHAGQVFIVNDAPRTKISTLETTGIPWRENVWHTLRVTRTAADGMIRVFFDDMHTAIMEAKDTTFGPGQVGFGSFDDTARFDDIIITGTPVTAAPQPDPSASTPARPTR